MKKYFLCFSGLSIFGNSLSVLCFLTLMAKTRDPMMVTLLISSTLLANTLSGLAAGFLFRHFKVKNMLYIFDFIRFLLLILCSVSYEASLYLIIVFNFILNAIEGAFHANRLQYINLYFKDIKIKNVFISHLQSIDTAGGIIGPVIAGLVIAFLPMSVCFLIDSFTYLISTIFWICQKQVDTHTKDKMRPLEGFYVVKNHPSLQKMIFARFICNIPTVIWTVLSPLILITVLGSDLFSYNQGVVLALMSVGVLMTNIGLPKIKKEQTENIEKNYFNLSYLPSFIGFLILGAGAVLGELNLIVMSLTSFCFGITVACFRSGGIILGQKITPQKTLHFVISFSDSIVRFVTALLLLFYGKMIGDSFNNTDILLSSAAAVIAVFLARKLYLSISTTSPFQGGARSFFFWR